MSVVKAISAIFCIIPTIISIAVLVGCENNDSSNDPALTVAQRRAAIDSANSHLNAGRITEALAITTRLIERDPLSPQSQESHALVLLADAGALDAIGDQPTARSKRIEALHSYEVACAASTNPGLLQLSTAQLAQMLGLDETAYRFYEEAHANVPKDGRSAFFIAQIHMLQSQWEKAKYWIDESLTRNPDEPYTLLSSAVIEAELGNGSKANQQATRGCVLQPNNPSLRLFQARVMRLNGDPTRALEIIASLPQTFRDTAISQNERAICIAMIEGNAQ